MDNFEAQTSVNNKTLRHRTRYACRLSGIQPSYYTPQQQIIWSSQKGLLKALEVFHQQPVQTLDDLENLIQKIKLKRYSEGMKKSQVVWQGESQWVSIYLKPEEIHSNLELSTKDGSLKIAINSQEKHIRLRKIKNADFMRLQVYLTPENFKLPKGYHNVLLKTNRRTLRSFFICAPSSLLPAPKKTWGTFAPLYALKSYSDWGVGSFRELKNLSDLLKPNGAQWMGTLPLLACNYDSPHSDPSPYSSLSRFFGNEIFLDIHDLLENSKSFLKAEDIHLFEKLKKENQAEIDHVRSLDHVDYHRVYKLKSIFFKFFCNRFFFYQQDQLPAFQLFLKENPLLLEYAQFRTQQTHETSQVLTLTEKDHIYVQFQIDQQLKLFKNSRKYLGLYLDYPVGVSELGFDFFKFKNIFRTELHAGAPPEPMYPEGQNWGFPPLNFENLAESQFEYFCATLSSHMRHSSLLRIDHIMGLYRMYSIPKGMSGTDGFYLRYGKEELFAIATLEAELNQVQLIGENLGTVPKAVDQILSQRNIYGMWVFYMDADHPWALENKPKNPSQLIGVNTHDMPAFAAFIEGLKHRDGFYKWVDLLRTTLQKHNKNEMITEPLSSPENFYLALLSYLIEHEAHYLVFNPEDCWLETQPQNQPGTMKYENWRKKFKYYLEDWNNISYVTKPLSLLKAFSYLKDKQSNE